MHPYHTSIHPCTHALIQHLQDTHALRAQCKATLDKLWVEFQGKTEEYRQETQERKLRFEALKKKDEESAHTIARQMRKIQRVQVGGGEGGE